MSKKAAYKFKAHNGTLADVIRSACGDLTTLGEEARELVDNMPESLQAAPRGEAFNNSADVLENISEPEVPAEAADLDIEYSASEPTRKGRGLSRARRLADAVGMLEAAVAVMEARKEQLEGAGEDGSTAHALAEALDTCITDTQNVIDECQDLEFPGMFG